MGSNDIIVRDESTDILGRIRLKRDRDSPESARFDPERGNLEVGGNGVDGELVLSDSSNNETVRLGEQTITIRRPTGEKFVELGRHGNLDIGGGQLDADVVMRDETGEERIHLDAGHGANTDPAHVRVFVDGRNGNITLGGDGRGGRLFLDNGGALTMDNTNGKPTVHLSGNAADLWLGGGGVDGDVVVRDQTGEERVHLNGGTHGNADPTHVRAFIDGSSGQMRLGGDGRSGDLFLQNGGRLWVQDRDNQAAVIVTSGDIYLPDIGFVRRKIQNLESRIRALEGR